MILLGFQLRQDRCKRCGLPHSNKKQKCPHCGDLDDFELERYLTETGLKVEKSGGMKSFFIFGGIVLLVIWILSITI